MYIDLSECKKGNHPLKMISSFNHGWDEEEVIRWCPVCGCIVVDMDTDNRTIRPGGYMKMQSPEISKGKV